MKKPCGMIRSRRSAEIRAKWATHLAARQASGLRQSEYCRENGVDPKYFSLWKGSLAREAAERTGASSMPAEPVALVPVVLTAARTEKVSLAGARRSTLATLSLNVTLPNGVALGFDLASLGALPGLLNELARLPP